MGTYTIRPGDTLSRLAARFNTSVQTLARMNGIRNVNLIYAGAKLRFPGSRDEFEGPRPGPGNGPRPSSGNGGAGLNGYNRSLGQRLAAASRQVAAELPGSGYCAKGVNMAIQRVTGWRPWANANELDNLLQNSSRFKEVHMSLEQALKIPGLVLTWERSNNSDAGRRYGHTAITWGDGRTTSSDTVQTSNPGAGRTGLRIFMPV